MKKLIFLIITLMFITLLTTEEHSENELFIAYQQDQTFENFQKAIEHYNAELITSKDDSSVIMLSYLYTMELHRNLEILQVNIDSLDTGTKFSYANLLLELDQFDESVAIYNQLNLDYPKWSCPWRHKGEALMKQQNYKDAEMATIKAIEVREDHFDAYIQLAKIQKEMGKYDIALQTLETGIKFVESDHEDEVSDEEVKLLKSELKSLIKK